MVLLIDGNASSNARIAHVCAKSDIPFFSSPDLSCSQCKQILDRVKWPISLYTWLRIAWCVTIFPVISQPAIFRIFFTDVDDGGAVHWFRWEFVAAYLAFLPQSENPEGIQGPLHIYAIMWIQIIELDIQWSRSIQWVVFRLVLLYVPEVLSYF